MLIKISLKYETRALRIKHKNDSRKSLIDTKSGAISFIRKCLYEVYHETVKAFPFNKAMETQNIMPYEKILQKETLWYNLS